MMWLMLRNLWNTLPGKPPHRRHPRRPAYRRPCLEVLEDRTAPASLSYSTFLHGTVDATAVDSAGDVYVTGGTDSSLPTTPGAFETTGSGAFVAKLNPTGTAVIYATYLGNGGGEGTGIAVDAAGDAYVIGASSNLPTTPNAIASSASGRSDTFVAELNPTGSGLTYSTYLPGAFADSGGYASLGLAGAIAVDGTGNIYVAGAAEAGLPVTAGAFQTAYRSGSGGSNAFFAKINPALSGTASVSYATYLGGTNSLGDAASGIALDGSGNAYLEGYTASTDFPTTSDAFQRTVHGFAAFVAKFNPALSGAASLVYSTYLGGSTTVKGQPPDAGYVSDTDSGYSSEIDGGIAVDSAGNAYVTSATTETNFPTTAGAYQTKSNIHAINNSSAYASDVFVTKLNATGSALVYSTYLGGGQNGRVGTRSGGASIAVDASGDAHVTGWTNSTSFPTVNALQTTNGGGFDAFVTVLNPTGSGLLFSSYFGGGGDDYGYGIALDSAGNAYVGGQTSSSNFPTTAGAYQRTAGSGFALKIDPPADVAEVAVPIPTDGTVNTDYTGTVYFTSSAPASLKSGSKFSVTPTVEDAYGNVLTGYTGTVHLSSSDSTASLPKNYTFTAGDAGVHTFTNLVLRKRGTQTLSVTDTQNSALTATDSISVS
jgi:hypothetical protein